MTWGIRVAPRRKGKSAILPPPSPRTRGCGDALRPSIREDRPVRSPAIPHCPAPHSRLHFSLRGVDAPGHTAARGATRRGTPTPISTLQPSKTALHRAACPQFGRTTHKYAAVPQNVPSRCTPLSEKRPVWGTGPAVLRRNNTPSRASTVPVVPRAKRIRFVPSDQPFCRPTNYICVVRHLLCPPCGGHVCTDLMDSPRRTVDL